MKLIKRGLKMLFRKIRSKIVFLWIFFFSLFLLPIISHASYEFDNSTNKKRVGEGSIKKNLKSSGYWNLEFKIHIDNNWSETESTYDWCSGSGTWSDPYVIENVKVNGGNSGSPILIENSNVYFRIKNSTIYNSSSGMFPIYEGGGGIKMVNVTKGTLINNIAFYNKYGILLSYSENNTLSGNTANNNTYSGIFLLESNNNLIWGNTVNYNLDMVGMHIYLSNNNTISGNTVNNNNGEGMLLERSNKNNISENNATNNKKSGIYLLGSNNNTLSGNTANNNTDSGIFLHYSDNNTLSGNTANNNTDSGIKLGRSDNNTLSGNTANNNTDSGIIFGGVYNTLSGNTANNNKRSGILVFSNNNTLSGNTANDNTYSGIILVGGYNILSGNSANNNKMSGILVNGDNNHVWENFANYNNESGIFLHYSDNNSVSGNFANNNYYGINLTISNFNNITGNTLFDNKICYSEDETSIGNTFKYNICVKGEPNEDNWIILGVIGIIIASLILIGLSVLFWQFKRKVKR